MAYWVKAPATKSNDLSLILRIYMVKRLHLAYTSWTMHSHIHIYTYIHTQVNRIQKLNIKLSKQH